MLMVKRYVVYAANCICDAPPNSDGQYVLVADYDALAARLAEADALIAKGLAVVHDFLPNIGRCVLQDYQRMNEFCSEAAARTAVSAVQPERCCLDYPRCDCNSPPEPDSAPTLQPCGHPWKAQHDFKCILCSSPGDATSAQLAEEQRFIHGAAAVTGLTQQDYDALVRDAMLWRTRSPTGAGGNARAYVCCEGVGQHAPGCIAQEAARCNCDLPMPVNSVDDEPEAFFARLSKGSWK
jgi:hypothetical protein